MKKNILLWMLVILLFYPAVTAYETGQVMDNVTEPVEIEAAVSSYQLSIWISWVVMICVAVYHKWTTESNFFFNIIYGYLLIGLGIFGFFVQRMVNILNIPSRFQDNYTLGVFTAIQNIAVAAILTGLLQAGVWWFTRRWHRR